MIEKEIKYGRGKFQPPESYIEYITFIADNSAYLGMPNPKTPNGKVNWQTSSGKTTSFYKDFEARFEWWVNKADELKILGTRNSDDRFSIAARIIHPTKEKVCLICGKKRYVGYMYINANTAKAWNTLTQTNLFEKAMPIFQAVELMDEILGEDETISAIKEAFPERSTYFQLLNEAEYYDFFFNTMHIRSSKLSPGYMGDAPHRFDGIHDYCLYCRKKSDPGRFDSNMDTYNHDRRAFQWWAEGDWLLADTVYNSAGEGYCTICNKYQKKISPDHVGPLACGFKQIGYFVPLCTRHNSAKNRRFTYNNTLDLIVYENAHNESVAGWQVRTLWDKTKGKICNDSQAKELSNYMRGAQDYYLRILYHIFHKGYSQFLSYLLKPEYALFSIEFEDLNPATFEFTSYKKTPKNTKLATSTTGRIVRIAFDELQEYITKPITKRKINKYLLQYLEEDIRTINDLLDNYPLSTTADKWDKCTKNHDITEAAKDQQIRELLSESQYELERASYATLKEALQNIFDSRGAELASIFLSEII